MPHTILVLTHKPIPHIYIYAEKYPDTSFYIHVDKKIDISSVNTQYMPNVYFLPSNFRINITWAGFSMVQAMINLFNFSLNHNVNNAFFHIISGDDILFENFYTNDFNSQVIYMEYIKSPRHRYRIRFNTPHADTKHQRKLYGKILTVAYKALDRILPSRQICLFGSQWFSISRNHLQILMSSIDKYYLKKFQKKLCPDEHFFQYLVEKNNLTSSLAPEGNKRYIHFDDNYQHGSSPIWLNISEIEHANNNKYWFCRKVQPDVINRFIEKQSLS